MTDEFITSHPYQPDGNGHLLEPKCGYVYERTYEGEPLQEREVCGEPASRHADPRGGPPHLIERYPHEFVEPSGGGDHCGYRSGTLVCGYPRSEHYVRRPKAGLPVRMADVAQYARPPMPDAARSGPVVTLIDAPVDPLGTLAVIGGIYKGEVYRSKSEVTDQQRREMLADMAKTALSGPLESIQFTFLVEGVSRSITHQMVRSRFSFFAQESLRFAVADDWAQEVPLPPSLAGRRDDDPLVMLWRSGLNAAEDRYAALVAAGMPAEEARDQLPHAITTRLHWVLDLRTLLLEAGKRTCTQAQFPWRQIFAGVAKALRERGDAGEYVDRPRAGDLSREASDGWQYLEMARLMRPMCYQEGACKMMASFDRGCTIRERVNAFSAAGVPSADWHRGYAGGGLYSFEGQDAGGIPAISDAEWAADPAAARVVE